MLGRRSAYTLLEVLLATAIGVILMGALYVAVDVQIRRTQAARDRVEHSTLSRSLLSRMSADIAASVGPRDPSQFRTSSSQSSGGSGATGGGTTGGATGGSGGAPTGGATGGGAAAADPTATQPATETPPAVNNPCIHPRVVGDLTRLTLFISRVPREANAANPNNNPVPGDVRRITYWLAGSGGTPAGLARQEVKWATSVDIDELPPDMPDDPGQIIAEEVRSLEFRYWDGTTWLESWDGGAVGPDGQTPLGPPLGIAILIGVAPRGAGANGQAVALKTYRQFVAINPANGATQVTTDGTNTTTTTP